jgi:hypothetical protein
MGCVSYGSTCITLEVYLASRLYRKSVEGATHGSLASDRIEIRNVCPWFLLFEAWAFRQIPASSAGRAIIFDTNIA